MLDINTGSLKIGENIEFGPRNSFDEIKIHKVGELQEIKGTNGSEYQSIHFKNVLVNGNYYIFRLRFGHNQLSQLEIFIGPSPFEFKKGWDDWSYQEELFHLELCKEWLKKQVGETREFDWGYIWCGYDSLGGYSSIKIRYI